MAKTWITTIEAAHAYEVATLKTFFMQQEGRQDEFVFLDPCGHQIPNRENVSDASWTLVDLMATPATFGFTCLARCARRCRDREHTRSPL
ncbi:MAG: hypothetical protein IT165_00435 [Bryobacterales bacterium]|nr:hypothetical protein [Bryobacterales bacterium]